MSSAHHQLDKTYVRERTIVLTGTVTAAEWVNPHVVLTMSVKNGGPAVVARTITLASGKQLVATTDGSWNWREMGTELSFPRSVNKSQSR